MTIKELMEYVRENIEEIKDGFNKFYTNEFLHLRKQQDRMFWFLLTTAVTTVTTLITVIVLLARG